MTIILSNEDAAELLPMPDCIAALEEMYVEFAHGRAASALRTDAVTTTSLLDTVYSLKLMGGAVASLGVGVLRLNSDIISFSGGRQKKMPLAPGKRYTGLVLLFSTETGEPLAIFPDGVLQRLRVGATSAIAAKYMARADAHTVALIGAGWQAGAQILAIAAVRKIDSIRCYSPTQEKCAAFCREMSELTGIKVLAVATPEAAVKGADIVLCATNATQHVFFERWLEPGMHVGTIRGPELEAGVLRSSDIVAVHDRSARPAIAVTRGVVMPEARHEVKDLPGSTNARRSPNSLQVWRRGALPRNRKARL